MSGEVSAESLERKRHVVELRDQGLSYRAIGERLGVSPSRVQQIATRDAARRRRYARHPLRSLIERGLSPRTANLLWRGRLRSADQIERCSDQELLALYEIGPRVLAEVRRLCGER